MSIRSPLGAIGAILAFTQAIAASALFAVHSESGLQIALVAIIGLVTVVLTSLVIWLIVYLVRKNPGLLFDPAYIDPSIHKWIYVNNKQGIVGKLEDEDSSKSNTS
jgi:hypothetical protein